MYVLGTLEPTWNCTHADGKTYEFSMKIVQISIKSKITVPSANNDSTCNYIKKNCASLTAVVIFSFLKFFNRSLPREQKYLIRVWLICE